MGIPRISYSAAREFSTCAYCYLLGLTDLVRPFQPALALGTTLHWVAAEALERFEQNQELVGLDELLPLLRQGLDRVDPQMEAPTEADFQEMMEQGEAKLGVLVKILPKVLRWQLQATEQWFEIGVGEGAGRVTVVGKMDWLFKDLASDIYYVYDLKTGSYYPDSSGNNPQLAAYVAALKVKYGEAATVRAFCVYLESSPTFVEYDQSLFDEDLEYLVKMARRIHSEKIFAKNSGPHCQWCPFQQPCYREDSQAA